MNRDSSKMPADKKSEMGKQRYMAAESFSEQSKSLKAEQVMSTPIVYLLSSATVSVALETLSSNEIRHIPILSSEHQFVGMISDRDIIRCMCGSGSVCVHCSKGKSNLFVESIMKGDVLSASVETDARHIARLFVEQRIGAIPITKDDVPVGIITRSDILKAVMVHFDLNLWS